MQGAQRPGSALARERIGGTQAATVSQVGKAGGSAASTMATTLGAQKQANRAMQEQDVMDMQFQQQQQMQYLNSLQQLAREQAMNWQWNEAQKFQEEADAARRLQEGGMQNIMGGLMTGTQLGFMKKMGYLGNDEGGFLGMGGGKGKQLDTALGLLQQGTPMMQGINMPENQWTPMMPTPLNRPREPIPTYGTKV